MNYKLINVNTKEQHLCEKIIVDGFDYYYIDELIRYNPNGGTNGNFVCLGEIESNKHHGVKLGDKQYVSPFVKNVGNCGGCRKLIATNNPNINIPKVVCNIDLTKLCYYDRRNPDFSIKEEYGYDKEEVEATGNFAKKDCACDNCFYGRSSLTEQLIKSQETHPNSDEDVIEFSKWKDYNFYQHIEDNLYRTMQARPMYKVLENKSYTLIELLQLWREQKPKIVYYEN